MELAAAGIVCSIIFLLFAKETRSTGVSTAKPQAVSVLPARMSTEEIVMHYETHLPGTHLPRALFWHVVGIASVLGMRDFAGVATLTLASIYLQKVFAYSPKQAGLAVGLMML